MGEERSEKGLVFFGVAVVVEVELELEGVASPGVELAVRRWTRSRQSRSSASVWWSKGSKLLRTVPEKRTGSWNGVSRLIHGWGKGIKGLLT